MNVESASSLITDNMSRQSYRPEDCYPNVVNVKEKYLGPYIPYVGKSYFTTYPRLLIYGMAQNLSQGGGKGLIDAWLDKPDKGIRRLYYDAPDMHMRLWDSGNLKVIAALALTCYPRSNFKPTANVYELVAVTNFVKFSFYRDKQGKRLDSNPPKQIYDVMWEHYCKYEVDILQPNVIIGCSKDITATICRNLDKKKYPGVKFLGIPFPLMPQLARWVHDGNERVKNEKYDPTKAISEMQALMVGTPDKDGSIRKTIRVNWYYFCEMKSRFIDACRS